MKVLAWLPFNVKLKWKCWRDYHLMKNWSESVGLIGIVCKIEVKVLAWLTTLQACSLTFTKDGATAGCSSDIIVSLFRWRIKERDLTQSYDKHPFVKLTTLQACSLTFTKDGATAGCSSDIIVSLFRWKRKGKRSDTVVWQTSLCQNNYITGLLPDLHQRRRHCRMLVRYHSKFIQMKKKREEIWHSRMTNTPLSN